MAQIRLRIVGESVIEVGDRTITPTSPQLFALLLYLGVEHHREVPRAELLELLYPAGDPIGDASHRLRQSLYKLKVMGAPVSFGDGTIRFEPRYVVNAVSELMSGGPDMRRECLARNFEILPHYATPPDTVLGEWVEQLREKLQNALRQHLTRDMEIARRKADWRYLEAIARRTLELDPLNESAVLGLAEATARTGSKARAVSILDAYRSELGEERANLALPASLLERRIEASRDRTPITRREPIPLIGRERELESLLSQWQSARRGNAHLVWLTGNNSVGKSRLLEEMAASVLLNGSGRVVSFSMSPLDADRPLSLFATMANRLSPLPGAAGCDPASLEALGKLSGSISIPRAVNPDNANSTFSDAAVRNAICDLVACVTDEKPVLISVDDAQHLDDASAHLLDTVLHRIANKRFLIVLTSIGEPSSLQHRHATLHIEPLSPESAQELWMALLAAQDTRLPEETSRKCIDTAAGNPGHLELLAQHAAQDPEQFLIPVDIVTLTERRLGQLGPQARYVLEAIVILDDAATASSVSYVTGLATYDLLTALHALESGDLIFNTASGLRCRSGLIADRVRANSSGTVTGVMEGKAAEYLEREQSGDRWSPSLAWSIASHWRRAGESRRARVYMRACWQHAVSIGQPANACSAIDETLRVTTDPEDRASLLDDLIGALQAAGDIRGVVSAVRDRKGLSSRVHDSSARVSQLAFDEAEATWFRNSRPEVPVSTLSTYLASPLLNAHRRFKAARLLMMSAEGDLDEALATYTMKACEAIVPESLPSKLLKSHVALIYHAIFGDADSALQLADEIQVETCHVERSWQTLMLERNCAFARQLVGTMPSDYACFERGFAEALDASLTPVALWFAGSMMSVLIDDGEVSTAQEWMETAERLEPSLSEEDRPIDYLGAQIDLALLNGDNRKAKRYYEATLKCARYQSARLRNDRLIYGLRVQNFFGGSWSPEEHLGELLRFHSIARHRTRHDDHMEVLWQALMAVGQPERATALLSDYLNLYRRERRPCRYMLRLRTQKDPAWVGLTNTSRAGAYSASTASTLACAQGQLAVMNEGCTRINGNLPPSDASKRNGVS